MELQKLWVQVVREGGARGEVGEGVLLMVTSLLCWLEPRDCQPAPNYEEVARSKGKKITCPPAL